MPYSADQHTPRPRPEELRARIPGWGVDLDPADRPSVPRLLAQPELDVRWEVPESQPELRPRERSIEHAHLTPVFGTTSPLRGVSGRIRRLAYDRFSEGRAAHWLLLIVGDRVDAFGSHVRSLVSARPDNPITETGVRSELSHHGVVSRRAGRRADVVHHMLDPVVVAGPWVAAGAIAYRSGRRIVRSAQRITSGSSALPAGYS